jgi:hypothetical protein
MDIKRSFHVGLLLSSIFVNMQNHAMEYINKGSNANIGHIDTLMLARTVAEDGYEPTKQKIDAHEFEKGFVFERRPPIYGKKPNPYIIQHRCVNNDGSELSKAVFDMIEMTEGEESGLIVENPLNQTCPKAISQCTTWEKIQNSKDVYAISRFHNKVALLAVLPTFRK